jgi:hypothetical protein
MATLYGRKKKTKECSASDHHLEGSIKEATPTDAPYMQHPETQDFGNSNSIDDDRNDNAQRYRSHHQPLFHRGHRTRMTKSDERVPSPSRKSLHFHKHSAKQTLGRERQRSLSSSPFLQWVAFLAVVSSLRIIWISTNDNAITKPSSSGNRATSSVSWMSRPLPRHIASETGRRRRTRPSPQSSIWGMMEKHIRGNNNDNLNLGPQRSVYMYPSISISNSTVARPVCDTNGQGHRMNHQRILISGILSHPIAAELALTLASDCGVRHIAGLAEHLLTVDHTNRLEFLMHQIPKLKVQISQYPLTDMRLQELVDRFAPTIIYHFEPLAFVAGTDHPDMYAIRTSLDQLARLCRVLARRQAQDSDSNRSTLIYINPLRLPSTIQPEGSTLPQLHPILLQTYRSAFEIPVIKLDLPTIFGPFREGAALLGLNETTDQFLKHPLAGSHPLIHVSDATRAIISTSETTSLESNSLPVLSPPESRTITLAKLRKSFKDLHQTKNISIKYAGRLYPILSWYFRQTTPHTTNFSMLPNKQATIKALGLVSKMLTSERISPSSVSQLERRQHNLFPCSSECARQSMSCRPSIWDETISISKKVTTECRYLLYTANFSESIVELPEVKVSINNASWPQAAFCQVALVSSKSRLVENVLGTNSSSASMNGNLTSNGWRLVWIDESENELSEADYMMPKIAPARLFSSQVGKAAYLEPQHMTSIPPLQVLCFLMAKRMDAKPVPSKTAYRNGQQVQLPPVPEKHIMFMGHNFDFFYDALLEESNPEYLFELSRTILAQKGKGITDDSKLPKRQLQSYSKSLQWQVEQDISFEPVDTYLLIHSLSYKQSKRLRCHWYEEQLFWSSRGKENRDLEDLSLSYVMHRWRRKQWLDTLPVSKDEERWGERLLVEEKKVSGDLERTTASFEMFAKLHSRMQARRIYG